MIAQSGDIAAPWLNFKVIFALGAVTFLAVVIIAAGLTGSGGNSSQVFNASENGCVLASDVFLDPRNIPERAAQFDCGANEVPADTQQLWLQIPLNRAGLTSNKLNLEGDSAPLAGLHIVHQDAWDRTVSRTLSPQDVGQAWTAGTRYSLTLTDQEANSDRLWLGVDEPWSRLAVNNVEIMSSERAMSERFSRIVWFAIYIGLGIGPIVYSLAFLVALRYPFMAWHAAMASAFLSYTFASSGLINQFLPGVEIWTRTLISHMSLSLACALAGYFSLSFVESDAVPSWVRRLMLWTSHLLVVNAAFIALAGPVLPFIARNIYHAAFIPIIIALIAMVATAILNKSRFIWFVVAGWWLITIAGLDRVLRGLDIYILPAELDFSLFLCLAVEVIVTACGVAYRVMYIRQERDISRLRERELVRQASTDLLTGLGNRRQFDMHVNEMPADALALIDIDKFKDINDNYGHQVGDEVLQTLGKLLKNFTRQDWCNGAYRLGGEEFAILMSVRGDDSAAICAEQIRTQVMRQIQAQVPALQEPVTISIGVSMTTGISRNAVYRNADVALYHAKTEGRNRIAVAGKAFGKNERPFLQVAVQGKIASAR